MIEQERTKLFLHEYRNISRESILHDAKWLEKNLQVEVVQSVQLRRTLRGMNQTHSEKRAAMARKTDTGHTLSIAADQGRKPDMYQVGQAVCDLILNRPNQQSFFFFEPFLKLDLLELRGRGYNVDRILRAKQEEARVLEEERRKALEAEEQSIRNREAERVRQNAAAGGTTREAESSRPKTPPQSPGLPGAMPGAFGESPEAPAPTQNGRRSRGFFSNISRRFGLDKDEEAEELLNNMKEPQPTSTGLQPGPPQPQGSGSTFSPVATQNNLLQAIRASRAHDSSGVFNPPQTQEVKESATYCDSKPAQDLVFAAQAPRGMKVYLSKHLSMDHMTFLGQNSGAVSKFETLLRDVGDIYGVSPTALQIHYDEDGPCIAFNTNGSIFCNLRFFLQLHYNKMRDNVGRTATDGRVEASVWWFVVVAHELAHNLVKVHDANHSYYTESFVQEYFGKMMAKASSWSAPVAAIAPTPAATGDDLPPYSPTA